MRKRLDLLGDLLAARRTLLSTRLRKGLDHHRVHKSITQRVPKAEIQSLMELYAWHDGADLHQRNPLAVENHQALKVALSLVPCEPHFFFPSFEYALGAFDDWAEYAKTRPLIAEAVGKYFPVLWNGAVVWLCVDIHPEMQNRVVEVNLDRQNPYCIVYSSFSDLLDDVLAANQNKQPLAAYRRAARKPQSCRTKR
jgi:hypothetical protein